MWGQQSEYLSFLPECKKVNEGWQNKKGEKITFKLNVNKVKSSPNIKDYYDNIFGPFNKLL